MKQYSVFILKRYHIEITFNIVTSTEDRYQQSGHTIEFVLRLVTKCSVCHNSTRYSIISTHYTIIIYNTINVFIFDPNNYRYRSGEKHQTVIYCTLGTIKSISLQMRYAVYLISLRAVLITT